MFVEQIKSQGLAHLSYLIGDSGVAAVVDPRRDIAIYLETARARGCRITEIFETHRNEDLVSGAPELSAATGAPVHHGPNPEGPVAYADTVRERDSFRVGAFRLEVLETPGHTDDSLSFALYDTDAGDAALAVFTGDALFVGDVGRTDFYPDRARAVAGLLFDSLRKIVALGDQAVVYPAHGAGSVCGGGMADRDFSTIGMERRSNPRLRIEDRDAFIDLKVAEHHYQPPYFRMMEHLNLVGGAPLPRPPAPPPLTAEAFEAAGTVRVDVRGIAAYLGAHVPGSLAMPADMVPAFAGWLLAPEDALALIADDADQAETAARHLARIGNDRVAGYLKPALTGWAASGRPFASVSVVDTGAVARRVAERPNDWTLLDVRSKPEVEAARIEGSRHIYVGKLAEQLGALDPERRYTAMCASGARATIAASVLLKAGFRNVDVYLGSMSAWQAEGRETV